MGNNTQDPELQQPEVLNEDLVAAYNDAPEGRLKTAASLTGRYVRRKIRENGFQRRIQPFEDIKQSDLSPSLVSELPHVIEEMEAEQPGAVSANYDDTPDTAFFRGDKFAVYLHLVQTPEFTKNVFALMTYKSDIREITTANMLKDIHTQEDTKYLKLVDKIVGSPTGVGASGVQQNFEIAGRISRESYVENYNHLEDLDLNNGVFARLAALNAMRAISSNCAKANAPRNRRTPRDENLACWCRPGERCHADVLLRLVNG